MPQYGAGSEERSRWFQLWRNVTAIDYPVVAPCITDQIRVVNKPAARNFRNVPTVETHILDFGSTANFLTDIKAGALQQWPACSRTVTSRAAPGALEADQERDGVWHRRGWPPCSTPVPLQPVGVR